MPPYLWVSIITMEPIKGFQNGLKSHAVREK